MTEPRANESAGAADPGSSAPPVGAERRWRTLPPAYSPLPARALARGIGNLIRRHDARAALAEQLQDTYGAERVALLDSGTHALELALRVASRLAPARSGIALPAYACFDLATAAVAAGPQLTLYDVVPDTLAPHRESLAEAMEAGAKVVVVAPLYGTSAPWDELHAAAKRSGAVLVEDAAQGYGSSWQGRIAGRHAALSVLSFGRGKGWTGGSGGALLARGGAASVLDEVLAEGRSPAESSTATLARAAGMSIFVNPSVFAVAAALPWLHLGETRYHTPTAPRRMSAAAASLLLASSGAADREAERRRAAADWYLERLAGASSVSPVPLVEGAEGGYLRFPIRVPRGMNGFADPQQARALGIAPGYPSPLGELLPVRARLMPAAHARQWPGAERVCRELITLPTHSLATTDERLAVVRMLERYAG